MAGVKGILLTQILYLAHLTHLEACSINLCFVFRFLNSLSFVYALLLIKKMNLKNTSEANIVKA